jgi:hypothetical protein
VHESKAHGDTRYDVPGIRGPIARR